jgi:hypothetical protein
MGLAGAIFMTNSASATKSSLLLTLQYSLTNPQPTANNTQNQNGPLPPYPPAALPSLSVSRAAAPTTHGAAAPYGLMQGACHRFRGGAAVGSPVGGANASPMKILRGRWGLGLRWPPINQDTQQLTQSWQKR